MLFLSMFLYIFILALKLPACALSASLFTREEQEISSCCFSFLFEIIFAALAEQVTSARDGTSGVQFHAVRLVSSFKIS